MKAPEDIRRAFLSHCDEQGTIDLGRVLDGLRYQDPDKTEILKRFSLANGRVSVNAFLDWLWPEAIELQGETSPDNYSDRHPYQSTQDTKFVELLRCGSMAVVKASYFHDRWEQGFCFEDRANIPSEYFFDGDEAVALWDIYGPAFLVIFSYSWLSKDHPDPQRFQLKRIHIALEMHHVLFSSLHNHIAKDKKLTSLAPGFVAPSKSAFLTTQGVVLDFCSLWQSRPGAPRTPEQADQFKDGLSEIDTPYAHCETFAFKLTVCPEGVSRGYDDRGWPLFESILIDSKAASRKLFVDFAGFNVMTFGTDFEQGFLKEEWDVKKFGKDKPPEGFVQALQKSRRMALKPEDFSKALELRRQRAEERGVSLFTSGGDYAFVEEKYAVAYSCTTQADSISRGGNNWGVEEIICLAKVLPDYKRLKTLLLPQNPFGDAGMEVLVAPLQRATSLEVLGLARCEMTNVGGLLIARCLQSMANLRWIFLFGNEMNHISWAAIAEAFPRLPKLSRLGLQESNIDDDGAVALAKHLHTLSRLEDLYLDTNVIGDEGAIAIAACLPCLRILASLMLYRNQIGDAGMAAIASSCTDLQELQSLSIFENALSDVGVHALMDAIPKMTSLKSLEVDDVNVDQFSNLVPLGCEVT